MSRLFTVTSCKNCPHRFVARTQGAGDALDWFCNASLPGKLIKGYIEYPSEEPKSIPNWCPLPEK